MKRQHRFVVLGFVTATLACTSPPAETPDPMKSFERLIAGEWKVTYASGQTEHSSWQWGPGRYSISQPGLELFYWHPGKKQLRILSMHPDIPAVGPGVGEGTMRFEGDTAEGTLDLYQPRGLRRLGIRWQFEGPDKYRDSLLEDSGSGMQPQNGWVRHRVPKRAEPVQPAAAESPKLTESMKVFEPLLGTWEGPNAQTTFQWIPEYIRARVAAPNKDGEPNHLLDAYFYKHVKTGRLLCLALSHRGGVYEGEFRMLEGGAMELPLKGYEEDRVVPLLVRLDFEKDGTLRQRTWSLEGNERTLILDVKHSRSQTRKRGSGGSLFTHPRED